LREVAACCERWTADEEGRVTCDLAIIGADRPAWRLRVYAASEGLKTVVLESFAPGGQAGASSLIETSSASPPASAAEI